MPGTKFSHLCSPQLALKPQTVQVVLVDRATWGLACYSGEVRTWALNGPGELGCLLMFRTRGVLRIRGSFLGVPKMIPVYSTLGSILGPPCMEAPRREVWNRG